MPQVQIYLTEEEYGEFLQEAHEKKIKVSALLAQKIREVKP